MAKNKPVTTVEMLDYTCPESSEALFTGVTNDYLLRGSAKVVDNWFLLTDSTPYQTGAVWLIGKFDVADPFEVSFSFSLCLGNDHDQPDGSNNGGNGLAMVIQTYDNAPIGEGGMGLGYDGLLNGLAVEFDSYQNGLYLDPPHDHIAMQVDDGFRLKAIHTEPYLKAMADRVDKFLATMYYPLMPTYGKVVYNGSRMDVYFTKKLPFGKPIISLLINIRETLRLGRERTAHIGFTATTGVATEQHWPHSIRIVTCSPRVLNVNAKNAQSTSTLDLVPNPANTFVRLLLPQGTRGVVSITDMMGCTRHTAPLDGANRIDST